jgi:hypothetical protein
LTPTDPNPYLRRTKVPKHGQLAEKRAAKRLGGRQTPGSGAFQGAKGDIRKGAFLIESKATVNASLSVTHAWLQKIDKEALDTGKTPALLVQFVDGSGRVKPSGAWVMIPERVFRELSE